MAAGAARAEEEERPKIFLEKRILADTSGGKKTFYEVHTVAQGENLWKILHRKGTLSPTEYARMVREFQRANPRVPDVRKLKAGQKVLVPSGPSKQPDPRIVEGKVVPHRVAKGDTLTRLLAARGVSRGDLPRYLDAVRKLNESVRDVDLIIAGSTVLLPSERYFGTPQPAVEARETPKVQPPEAPREVMPVTVAKPIPPEKPPAPAETRKEVAAVPPPALVPIKEVAPAAVAKPVTPLTKEAPPPALVKEVPPAQPLAKPKVIPLEPPTALAKEAPQVPPLAPPKTIPPEPFTALAKEVPPAPPLAKPKVIPLEPPTALAKEAPQVKDVPPVALVKEAPSVPQVTVTKEVPPESPVVLTKAVPPQPVKAVDAPARPEAQLLTPPPSQAAAPALEVRPMPRKDEGPKKEEPALPPPKPPYRGLLTDLLAGLGEKWADRGTLYLPVPSGGEVVLNLEDFPVARFSNGTQVLIDFHGALPDNIRSLIMDTWKNYRVVSMDGTKDAWEIIRRLLQASGYHSVKDGLARPLVIGEGVSIALPARWIVLRTPDSLLSGEVILIKEVPEKPSGDLAAVIRYAERVGIRVLPFATDPNALEGFLVGLDAPDEKGDPPPRAATPSGGLPALDFALDFLGITRKEGERLRIGGKGDSFQLVVQPERLFEAGGKRYVTDTGRMAPALRTLIRDSGYRIFPVLQKDSGRDIFQRALKDSGISSEARRDYIVSGGEKEGYTVRVSGTFITSKEWLEGRKTSVAVLYGGRTHSATRILMRDLGVEIVEW